MKKYRITLTKKEAQKINDLLREEYEALVNVHAAESSKDFIGNLLDRFFKLSHRPK